ncbi:hypothetical protein TSPI_06335 [Trichinella spiralis]|uniref:Uncharacterized protein n=1 Tax=Trichinella spiralis TaxID=6334 RepID=A0ABR3KY54_TRISP
MSLHIGSFLERGASWNIGKVEKKLCTVALHPVIAGVRLSIQGFPKQSIMKMFRFVLAMKSTQAVLIITNPLVFVWKDFLTLTVNYVIAQLSQMKLPSLTSCILICYPQAVVISVSIQMFFLISQIFHPHWKYLR